MGVGIGPWGLGLITLNPLDDAVLLERVAEIAVLISLFTVGLKLDLPLRDARWRIPLQLATVSMLRTVAAITAAGIWRLKLPLGGAVLLGGILAPTDPVLASDVQVADRQDRHRLRFGLTGEGGMNDGTAFPVVMLGLGLLSLHNLGEGGWRGGRWTCSGPWQAAWASALHSAPSRAAPFCSCACVFARRWVRTNSWCWGSLRWPTAWPCCATPTASWRSLPQAWLCGAWPQSQ